MNSQADNKIILEKVKKLLALATSSNENEASVATNKAQELLTRYNLTMQSIESNEYEKVCLSKEPYLKPHQTYINHILSKYFFVEVVTSNIPCGWTVDNRRKFKKHIMVAGTATNVAIAEYVFAFLSTTYLSLWLEYKRKNNVGEALRVSYYNGLTKSLEEKLKATIQKVENEMGLVVVKDQNILKTMFGDTRAVSTKVRTDAATALAGQQDGKNINIAKPITNEKSSEKAKLLR